jgi:hypothetical protein
MHCLNICPTACATAFFRKQSKNFFFLSVSCLRHNFVKGSEGGFRGVVPLHCQRVEGAPPALKGWQTTNLIHHLKI